MTTKELNFILQEGEGLKIEFKENISSIDKSMVAFANSEGGRIFVGVDDLKQVKGIIFTNRLRSQICDIARNCDPPVNISLDRFEKVVIINVPSSVNKPHKCSDGFYIRKDATSQKMGRDELVNFIHGQGIRKFDSLPCYNCETKHLDKNAIKEYLIKAGVSNVKASLNDVLFNLGVRRDGQINNAGVLFFSKSPKDYYINAYVTCARYLGTKKVDVLDRADFDGNIVSQVDETIKFIKRNIRLSYKIKDIQREEIPEYPAGAIREAVINAIMHRDYFETGSNVQVDIFDDRLEISNVGALIKPLTRVKLGKFAVRRNPLVSDLFYRIKYVEKMGTGLGRIKDECKRYKTKLRIETNGCFIIMFKPVFLQNTTQKTTYPTTQEIIQEDARKFAQNTTQKTTHPTTQKLLDIMSKYPYITQKVLSNAIGITEYGVKYHLTNLKMKGVIKHIGPDKGGYWKIVGSEMQ